jgi:DNA-binding XRE family transcriptional regulator
VKPQVRGREALAAKLWPMPGRDFWAHEPYPPNPVLIVLGQRIRGARQRAWMTQAKFGERVGLDQGSVSRLERGLLPSIRLDRLAPALRAAGIIELPDRSRIADAD